MVLFNRSEVPAPSRLQSRNKHKEDDRGAGEAPLHCKGYCGYFVYMYLVRSWVN